MSTIQVWGAPSVKELNTLSTEEVVLHSDETNLTDSQKTQIVNAFNAGAFDMATEYAWKKTMVKLKEVISGLGIDFLANLLHRDDINEYTLLENVISDSDAINVAEQLGIINREGAMSLRHAKEQLNYYFSTDASQKGASLDQPHAAAILADCVKFVLSIPNVQVDVEFQNFKECLLETTLTESSKEYQQVESAPLFYVRTICSILLASIQKEEGAHMEHACENLTLLLPIMWPKMGEDDRWNVGNAYRNVVTDGKSHQAQAMKFALLKVHGFDYVPETLRSNTFIMVAQKLLDAHYEFNNFYNEPPLARALANLGSTIPSHAFGKCMQAYLCVYIGNNYGVSKDAAIMAEKELKKISKERWNIYWAKYIQNDSDVLYHIVGGQNQFSRFCDLIASCELDKLDSLPKSPQLLFNAVISRNYTSAANVAKLMASKLLRS